MLKGFTRKFKPLEILTQEQVEEIHRATLDVLWQTGVRFESERALKLFAKNGCKVDYKMHLVRFMPDLVEECLRRCPSRHLVRSRDPKHDLMIGGNTVYFDASVGMRAADPDTGEWHRPTLRENYNGVKVLDALDNIHRLTSYCPYADIKEIPAAMQYTINAACRFRYSTKVSRTEHAAGSGQFAMKMAHTCGMDINANMEASPPLTFYEDAITNAFWACEVPEYSHFPVVFADGDIMAATAPATFAGSLVTSSAEITAGIVMVQLLQPGKPVAAGHFVFPMDMRYGHPGFGGIECALHNVAFNQIWRRHDIPIIDYGGALFTLAKNIGYQTGADKMQNLIISAISGANVIAIAGGLFAELTWSPELAILDNDLCGAVGRFIEGFEVSGQTLALDVIHEVGPIPGIYLNQAHTREWWKKEFYASQVMDTLPYDVWIKEGKKNALNYAKERLKEILATHEVSVPLTEEQDRDINNIIEEAMVYYRGKGMLSEQDVIQCRKTWKSVR